MTTPTQPCTAMVRRNGHGTVYVYPDSVFERQGHPRRFQWSCSCGKGRGSYEDERECRDDGGEHQVSHNTATCGEPVAELAPMQPLHPDGSLPIGAYQLPPQLVHVTLGPCEVGLETKVDSRGQEVVWRCGEEAEHASHGYGPGQHPYAPTVTERTMEHEAEVSDGPKA